MPLRLRKLAPIRNPGGVPTLELLLDPGASIHAGAADHLQPTREAIARGEPTLAALTPSPPMARTNHTGAHRRVKCKLLLASRQCVVLRLDNRALDLAGVQMIDHHLVDLALAPRDVLPIPEFGAEPVLQVLCEARHTIDRVSYNKVHASLAGQGGAGGRTCNINGCFHLAGCGMEGKVLRRAAILLLDDRAEPVPCPLPMPWTPKKVHPHMLQKVFL